jgi:2,3-bisphosphoglycerate-independent phosphoglycerate mutase
METESLDNPDSILETIKRPRPVVFLLIDSWGIGQNQPGNVFFELKLKNWQSLIKKYPLALLDKSGQSVKERYGSLGAYGLFTASLSEAGLSQLHLTESEKMLDSWHNFNGSRDFKLPNEELKVISSELGDRQDNPKQVSTKITDLALNDIKKDKHDVIFINLANLDLLSKTGDLEAAKEAAKLLDKNIGRIASTVLKHHGLLIISAAYGRAEAMINMATEMPNLEITDNPVPFIIVSEDYEGKTIGLADPLNGDLSLLASAGTLDDVVPTILKVLEIPLPSELKGESLI